MQGKAERAFVSFGHGSEIPGRGAEGQFRGVEVEVGFGGHFRRFSEGSGGVSGGFREAEIDFLASFSWRFSRS